MRRFTLLGLAVLAVFALTSVVTGSASAQGLPSILPETVGKSGDLTGTTSRFEILNGKFVLCTSATGTMTEEGKPLGKLHIDFKGCTTTEGGVTVKCTGLSEAVAGEILVLGLWHLVYDTGGTELGVGLLFLIETVHFTCGGVVLIKVEGGVLCLILEPYVLKELHEFHCKIKMGSIGDPEESEFLNDETPGKFVKDECKASVNEAAAESCAESALGLILWLEGVNDVDVLIMMT